MPWNRAIKETRNGRHNAIIGAYKEDAPDFIFSEEKFGVSVMAFFTKKENRFKHIGLESLLTVKIGSNLIISYVFFCIELDNPS